MLEADLQKDGTGVVLHVWEIDETKPKIWVENGAYQFNNTLRKSVYFRSVEILLDKLGVTV